MTVTSTRNKTISHSSHYFRSPSLLISHVELYFSSRLVLFVPACTDICCSLLAIAGKLIITPQTLLYHKRKYQSRRSHHSMWLLTTEQTEQRQRDSMTADTKQLWDIVHKPLDFRTCVRKWWNRQHTYLK